MSIDKKLSSLQEISKAQLSKILSSVPSTKHIVLEPLLIRPLEKVCGAKWLKGNGIEKIFKLENGTPNFGNLPVFYMIFNNGTVFKQVIQQIRSLINQNEPIQNYFHLILVPKALYIYEEELEELGLLHSHIKLHSFHWMPIHLDTGILSLEIPHLYNKLFIKQDSTLLPVLTNSLWRLLFVVGKPNFLLGLGENANTILKQLEYLNDDLGESDKPDADFGCIIIMDRNMDYTSTLLTPGTYAALVNEVYGVQTGVCELKNDNSELITDNKGNPILAKQKVNFNLDSNQDKVYADIKNRYFTEVTSVLSALTKQLKLEKISSKEMALDEMKHYVQTQLQATKQKKQCITNHLLAAETIINVLGPRYEMIQQIELNILKNTNKSINCQYLDELLSTENDKFVTLRLFCLLNVAQQLTENEIKSFWRKYLHQFGFKYSCGYRNLINGGFLPEPTQQFSTSIQSKIKLPKFTQSHFYTNMNRLKQIPSNPEKISLQHPTCASYVFGGSYIPLVTQITSLVLNSVPLDEIKAKLETYGTLTIRNDRAYPLQRRSVLIYLLGGVTYAEIAACNLLETLTGTKIVILSDRIISGNDLMDGILEESL